MKILFVTVTKVVDRLKLLFGIDKRTNLNKGPLV